MKTLSPSVNFFLLVVQTLNYLDMRYYGVQSGNNSGLRKVLHLDKTGDMQQEHSHNVTPSK